MPPVEKSRCRQESKPYDRPLTPYPTATQEPDKTTRNKNNLKIDSDWGGSLQPRTYDPAQSPQTAWRDPEDPRAVMVALADHLLLRRFIEISEELFRQDSEGTKNPQRWKDFVVYQANLFRERLGLSTDNEQGEKDNENEIGERPQAFAMSILQDHKSDDCVIEQAPDADLVQEPSKKSSVIKRRERKERVVVKQMAEHKRDNAMEDTHKPLSNTQTSSIVFTDPFAEDKSQELTASEIMKDVLDAYPEKPVPSETVVKKHSILKQRTKSCVSDISVNTSWKDGVPEPKYIRSRQPVISEEPEPPHKDKQNERLPSLDKDRGEVYDHRLWETDL